MLNAVSYAIQAAGPSLESFKFKGKLYLFHVLHEI